MGSMEDRVRELICDAFGSVPKLAKAVDLPPQTIYSALRNGLMGASMATVMPIAAGLRIDPFQITHNRVVPLPDRMQGYSEVPLLGSLQAGAPAEPVAFSETFPIPDRLARKHPKAFLVAVSGESMNRVLPNGCLALVDPSSREIVSGKIYALTMNTTGATVKRVRLTDDGMVLEPDSTDPAFEPYVVSLSGTIRDQVTVIGRVVWFCPPFDWGRLL